MGLSLEAFGKQEYFECFYCLCETELYNSKPGITFVALSL
jgi:hypothetical protein